MGQAIPVRLGGLGQAERGRAQDFARNILKCVDVFVFVELATRVHGFRDDWNGTAGEPHTQNTQDRDSEGTIRHSHCKAGVSLQALHAEERGEEDVSATTVCSLQRHLRSAVPKSLIFFEESVRGASGREAQLDVCGICEGGLKGTQSGDTGDPKFWYGKSPGWACSFWMGGGVGDTVGTGGA